MAVVRAICRSDLERPDRRLLRRPRRGAAVRHRQGPPGGLRLRHPRLDRPRPPLAGRPPGRAGWPSPSSTRGCSSPGSRRPPGGCRSSPPGPASAPTCCVVNPELRTVRSPYDEGPFADPADAGAEFVAAPALRLDAAFVHANRADTAGNAQFLGPDRFFDELFLGAAARRFVTAERVVEPRRAGRRGPAGRGHRPPHADRRRGRDAGRRPLHLVPARLRARRGVPDASTPSAADPEAWAAFSRPLPRGGRGRLPRRRGGPVSAGTPPGPRCARWPAPSCGATPARCLVSPFGTVPTLGARLARLTFSPDIVLTDGEAALMVGAPAVADRPRRPGARGGHALPHASSTWCGRVAAT